MWAVGCIFVELLTLDMLVSKSFNNAQALQKIFACIGTPTQESAPSLFQKKKALPVILR